MEGEWRSPEAVRAGYVVGRKGAAAEVARITDGSDDEHRMPYGNLRHFEIRILVYATPHSLIISAVFEFRVTRVSNR